MQTFFFESPWLLGIVGIACVGIAFFVWTQVGHRAALWAAAVIAAATIVLVLICQQVVTDRESIQHTIDEVAEALSRNDLDRVYSYIHTGASEGVARAQGELPQFKFTEARMTRLKSITVDNSREPASALAEFNVFVAGELQGQTFKVPRFVKVYFTKQGPRWLVRDYEHFEPTAGFRNTD